MPRGGKREGAGRKPGSLSKKTREIATRVAEEGITPLEFLLRVMRDEAQQLERRIDAAKSAAPFVHAKLSAVEHSGAADAPVVAEIRMVPVSKGE